MKVFIGFGYNDQDKWIKQLVIPLVETLGCSVVTGEEMQGEQLSQGVIDRIADSDACIGLLTKRGKKKNADGTYPTHRWVIEELTTALNLGKAIFEIRENCIDGQMGIIGDRQRFSFKDTSEVMLEVTKFVVNVKRKFKSKVFMLLPEEVIKEVNPHLGKGDIRCSYTFMVKNKKTTPIDAVIEKFEGGLGVIVNNIPDDDNTTIQILIKGPGGLSWSSYFVPVGSIKVHIQKD
jgi:hypothetical protein